jgi:hypothetical protein
MSKPPSNFGWNFPKKSNMVNVTPDWDSDDDMKMGCCIAGCTKRCVMEFECYKGGDVKYEADTPYDSGKYFPVTECECQAPCCDDCTEDPPFNTVCRICGAVTDVETVSKKTVMHAKNWRRDSSDRAFWFAMHFDCNEFQKQNFPRGGFTKFSQWFFKKTGERIDMTEVNTRDTCEIVDRFILQESKYSFLQRAFSFEFPQYSSEPHFKLFLRTSQTVCRFLAIDSFSDKKLAKVYPFFGLTAKVIQTLLQHKFPRQGYLSWFFVRLIARYFKKRCQF